MSKRSISAAEAKRIGEALPNPKTTVELEQFRRVLEVELEHGSHDPQVNATNDDEPLTGKIVWAHLKESPDYHTLLRNLEGEANAYWASLR
jgi:hypothetical protein